MRDNRGDRDAETGADTDTCAARAHPVPPLPDLKPWNQAGWIFLGGDCVAIERQGEPLEEPDRTTRVLAD